MPMILCSFRATGEFNEDGESRVRCARKECQLAYWTTSKPETTYARCRVSTTPTLCGVGCQLAATFKWFGIVDDGTCACQSRAAVMDRRGPDWCRRRVNRILGWLREAAAKRNMPYVEAVARAAVHAAIHRARKNFAAFSEGAQFMPGLGDLLVKHLPWFDDHGLLSRLDRRGPGWAGNRSGRIMKWIETLAAEKGMALPAGAAQAALDAAIAECREQASQAELPPAQPPAVLAVDDPLVVYDATGEKASGLKNLWRGCAGFLVCGGPSVRDLPYHKLAERGVVSLGVNNVCGMVPVKAMTFNDPAEKFHEGVLADGGIIKLIPKPRLTRKSHTRRRRPDGGFELTGRNMPDYPNVWAFERRGWHTPETFLTDPAATYGTDAKGHEKTKRPRIIFTMFMALRLMHYLGCRRVYLLGADFHMDPAKGLKGNYAFDDDRYADTADPDQHRREVMGVINGNNDHYRVANEMLVELRPFLDAAGFHVFNCNPWSRLAAFDHVSFEDALQDCRNGVPEGELSLNGHYKKGV